MNFVGLLIAASVATSIPLVGVIGDADRRTEAAYARENGKSLTEVRQRYAANGRLICDKAILNANLVLVNDLLVTSAHTFFKGKDCAKKSSPKTCRFEVKIGGTVKQSRIKNLEAIGYGCGIGVNGRQSPADDWALLRLEDQIEGVIPFSISSGKGLKNDYPITAVSSVNVDFFPNGQQSSQFVKSIGNCRALKIYRSDDEAIFFSSDCDGTGGSSGAAFLDDTRGPAPVLLGIYRGDHETEEQLAEAVRKRSSNKAKYVESEWATYGVPLHGDFLRSILAAAQR